MCGLDGSVLYRLIATFCLLPYLIRKQIDLLFELLDIDTAKLQEFEETDLLDDDNLLTMFEKEEND